MKFAGINDNEFATLMNGLDAPLVEINAIGNKLKAEVESTKTFLDSDFGTVYRSKMLSILNNFPIICNNLDKYITRLKNTYIGYEEIDIEQKKNITDSIENL